MEQFFGLLVLALIIWFIYMMRSRKKDSRNLSATKSQNVSTGSSFNLQGENITVTLIGPKGNQRVSRFSVFDIETINLMKPTSRKNGMIQFVLKSGMVTEPLEVESKSRALLDEALAEIERVLEGTADSQFNSGQEFEQTSNLQVQFDGRLRTHELEYIAPNKENPYDQAIIQIDDPEFAVVDVETTGLYPDNGDRIVEIAVVVMNSHGDVLSDWSSTINPLRKMGATAVHGLTDKDVEGSPTLKDVAPKIIEIISNRIFVAHNASFDYRFIRKELLAAGIELEPSRFPVFDTMSLATKTFPGIPNKKMESLLAVMQLDISSLPGRGSHSALTDAHAGAQILSLYLHNNRQAVLDAVNWPLLQTWSKPRILTNAEVLAIDEKKRIEDEFMSSLLSNPPLEIQIQKFTEVYFTGFMPEQEVLIQQFTRQWQVTRAERVTKKKCSLVVTAETSRASGAVKSAMKWDIPVIALEHASKIRPAD